jgi:hypothetical protein
MPYIKVVVVVMMMMKVMASSLLILNIIYKQVPKDLLYTYMEQTYPIYVGS